ncbi:MAG: ComF family protein [Elusimicrobiaceae bacterium]|nr:ComF family protein [Elusimicrobiaceae bacterium]
MSQFNFNFLTNLKEILLHVLLPNTCYACCRDLAYRDTSALCPSCLANIKTVGNLYCLRCGKPLPDGGAHCYQCRGSKTHRFKCSLIRSAVLFGPEVRELVHAFKYADQAYLSDFLADIMLAHYSKYSELSTAQLLVPVPLYHKKAQSRGYNQAELLASALGKKLKVSVGCQILKRVRNTPSQTKLGREDRLKNMCGAFACVRPEQVKGKVILLIDDVATTGATLEGCAEALKKAGAKKVMAYTFAREN